MLPKTHLKGKLFFPNPRICFINSSLGFHVCKYFVFIRPFCYFLFFPALDVPTLLLLVILMHAQHMAKMGGIFISENKSSKHINLIGARTSVCRNVELHTHLKDGEYLSHEIYSVYCHKPRIYCLTRTRRTSYYADEIKKPLFEGESIQMTLLFDNAEQQKLSIPVQKKQFTQKLWMHQREIERLKMDYKNTVFLPKTSFSMKAQLPQKEPEILDFLGKN